MTSKECMEVAVSALEEKKGINLKVIDISKISPFADYFVIVNGSNERQVQALADNVQEKLAEQGVEMRNVEGYRSGNWILMDFNEVIVHVFDAETRSFYELERLWSDGETVNI